MFIPPPPNPDPPPQRDSEPQAEASDESLHELAGYVLDCLNHGSQPADIRKSLVAKGLTDADAEAVVNQVLYHQSDGALGYDYRDIEAVRAAGRRNMAIGGIVCGIGLLVTLGTMAAAGEGGGRVVIAWGAIVFGAIQFFRGMGQANQGRGN